MATPELSLLLSDASSVAGALQYGDCGPAAEDVLVGAAGTGNADAADDHDAVDDWNPAAHWHDAAAVRDSEAAQPRLPRLGRKFGCRQMEGGRRISLMEGKLRGPRLGAVHLSDGDRIAGLIHDRDRHCNANGLRVFLG